MPIGHAAAGNQLPEKVMKMGGLADQCKLDYRVSPRSRGNLLSAKLALKTRNKVVLSTKNRSQTPHWQASAGPTVAQSVKHTIRVPTLRNPPTQIPG